MKSSTYYTALVVAALAAQHAEAFQPSVSRRALLQNIATTAGAGIVASSAIVLLPDVASARLAEKKPKKELLRGGKNMSDALHNGTDLNGKEAEVAGSLLDKMGLADITPDNGASTRAPPKPKKR